ncbi:uncharacterized protein BCR38DRAFT_451202, partial [Pseudomassariella vexata]
MCMDNDGRTALFLSARYGHDSLVRLLLRKCPLELYTKDHYSATPLFAALRNGHLQVAKLLLITDDTCIGTRDCFDRTLMWWARRSRNTQLIQLIHHYSTKAGLQVDESDMSTETGPVTFNPTSNWCNVCTLCIRDGSDYYKCGICNGGDFAICLECFKFGVECQNSSHRWELH